MSAITKEIEFAKVYRYFDAIVVRLGDGDDTNITLTMSTLIAKAMVDAVEDTVKHKFYDSPLGVWEIHKKDPLPMS